ncbi:hypothetical protein PAEPH01_2042 [Pancytospora epiphaga]|nr:hypothetical protein PAEPH01_2042 [Pancytospora epiphaga]
MSLVTASRRRFTHLYGLDQQLSISVGRAGVFCQGRKVRFLHNGAARTIAWVSPRLSQAIKKYPEWKHNDGGALESTNDKPLRIGCGLTKHAPDVVECLQ